MSLSPAQKLLRWYRKHGRNLPWRHTRDAYKILVSEIMLQQTQVSRGLIFYDRWLTQFPDWNTLASAGNADVIKAWSGLGYNRRALALRDIAKQVVDSGIPQTEEEWIKIKGIGPYTAAAISAFSQKKRTLPIDTNIRRVLARLLFGIPYPDLKTDDRIAKQMDTFLPRRGKFYDVPQAIFDLATTTCLKQPECKRCPLRNDCKAAKKFLEGNVKAPKAMIKKAKEKKHRNKRYPDRIYRGRLLKLVKEANNGIDLHKAGELIDKTFEKPLDQTWLESMIGRLEKEGFIEKKGRNYRLKN